MKRFRLRVAIRFLSFSLLFVGLAGLAVMVLWNALLPPILGVRAISFGQAIGLLVLSRILFGGPRGYGPRGFGSRWRNGPESGGWGGYGPIEWKEKMNERWQKMTPEQRDQIRQQWRDKCAPSRRGRWGRGSQSEQPGSGEPGETGNTAI
ncbi:MAG: hypothetical protein JWP57_2386 [Spirosoma sp.]|nr:hypothetical protein [Spirosoma sp.]